MAVEHAAEATFEAAGNFLASPAVLAVATIAGVAAISYFAVRNVFRSFS